MHFVYILLLNFLRLYFNFQILCFSLYLNCNENGFNIFLPHSDFFFVPGAGKTTDFQFLK